MGEVFGALKVNGTYFVVGSEATWTLAVMLLLTLPVFWWVSRKHKFEHGIGPAAIVCAILAGLALLGAPSEWIMGLEFMVLVPIFIWSRGGQKRSYLAFMVAMTAVCGLGIMSIIPFQYQATIELSLDEVKFNVFDRPGSLARRDVQQIHVIWGRQVVPESTTRLVDFLRLSGPAWPSHFGFDDLLGSWRPDAWRYAREAILRVGGCRSKRPHCHL